MLRYGLYARKSHDDKKLTEKSTGEQIAECKALASREGLAVVWECEESKSAKIPFVRPHYAELIKLIEKGKIDAILCWHVNRIIRNMDEGGHFVQLWIDGKLKEVRTPHAVYRTGDNILPIVLEAASATQSSLDLVHVVRRSHDGNFRAGGWNHKVPPGYRNVRDPLTTKRGMVIADPERFALARKAWDRMLTGTETVWAVYLALDEWGYRVRETLNLPERPLSYSAVMGMFRNPFYAGYVRERGEMVKGRHEPMVSLDEFRRVQNILAKRSFKAVRSYDHDYTGFMTCAYCGQRVTAEHKKISTGSWEVYHCSDTYNRCTQKGMSVAAVEQDVTNLLSNVRIDPEALDIAGAEIKRSLTARQATYAVRAEETRASLQLIEQRLRRLTEMWISGLLTEEARYQELEGEALREKERLQLAVEEIGFDTERRLRNLARALDYLKTKDTRFAKARPARKRPVAQALGKFLFYGREKVIKAEVRPILREIVEFVSHFSGPLEPPKTGSRSHEKTTLVESFHLGGTVPNGIELPEPLEKALLEDDMPDLDCSESEYGLLK